MRRPRALGRMKYTATILRKISVRTAGGGADDQFIANDPPETFKCGIDTPSAGRLIGEEKITTQHRRTIWARSAAIPADFSDADKVLLEGEKYRIEAINPMGENRRFTEMLLDRA